MFQSRDKTILYAVACILVNCTNCYDKKEIIPELVQLAKFSKQHVPEQHPKVKSATQRKPYQEHNAEVGVDTEGSVTVLTYIL